MAGLAPARPGRPLDTAGIALGYVRIGSAARALAADTRLLTGIAAPAPDYEAVIELTYQMNIAPWWYMQPDLQVVRLPAGGQQHPFHLAAEVALHFQDKSTDFPLRIARAPPQELIDVRIHARGGLAGADGAENHDARVEAPLWDREPLRLGRRSHRAREMGLADEIRELIHLVTETGIAELELQRGEDRVRIRRAFAAALPSHVTFVETSAGHVESWNVDPKRYDTAVSSFLASLAHT